MEAHVVPEVVMALCSPGALRVAPGYVRVVIDTQEESMRSIADTLTHYAACVTAKDIDGIVGLYADDATIEIPVGGPVHRGIAAIRAFYTENELAQHLEIAGRACVAGREAAVPMRARIRRDGKLFELDVIDVAAIDDQGRLTQLRAFYDLAGARPLHEGFARLV